MFFHEFFYYIRLPPKVWVWGDFYEHRLNIEKLTNPNSDFFEKFHDPPPPQKKYLVLCSQHFRPIFHNDFQRATRQNRFTPPKYGSEATFVKIG